MPGLAPGIHVFETDVEDEDVDGQDRPGHDGAKMRGLRASQLSSVFEPLAWFLMISMMLRM
jgi:hypothetical protein